MSIAAGLRITRDTIEKRAGKLPLLGMGVGAGVGAAGSVVSRMGEAVGKSATSVLADSAPAELKSFVAKNMRTGEGEAAHGLFHTDAAGNIAHHPDAKAMDYARAYGPDALRQAANWGGTGGLLQAGHGYLKNRALVSKVEEYAPYAAAGLGGLAAYKALKD